MREKLRSDSGETLVEVLASIVIASLSVALLFGCVMASSSMDRGAEKLDAEHYQHLSDAEERTGASEHSKVTVWNLAFPEESLDGKKDLEITIYGGAGMYSYGRKGP